MGKFLYGIILQWKLDLRDKGIIITYYVVPLLFFIFMGGVFTSINPEAYKTLIPSMTVFSIIMGAFIGSPSPLVRFFGSDIKKSYQVGGIPLWTAVVNNFISAFINLFIVSIVIFVVAKIAFKADVPVNISSYFISLVLFLSTSIAVGTVLGLLVKNESKLTMISQVVFLPSMILSGIMFPADMLPEALQHLGKVFPATWGFINMANGALDIKKLLPLIIILTVCIAITVLRLKALTNNKSKSNSNVNKVII